MGTSPRPRVCIAGLGNPGEEYRDTRHNVGFHVVDVLAARIGADIRRPEFRALTGEGILARTMVLLMKPQTFMNASGRSVADALSSLGLGPGGLIAVYDDLDLPLGRLRLREGGGSGGHRGVASLVAELGDPGFTRVRVGIGRPPEGVAVIEHVLSPFSPEERQEAGKMVELAADAVEAIVAGGLEAARTSLAGR